MMREINSIKDTVNKDTLELRVQTPKISLIPVSPIHDYLFIGSFKRPT